MARTALFDPIVVTLTPSPATLQDLVDRKAESAKLDYKERYTPSDRLSTVRLVKHVLAMANTAGGYLVIGVKNDGTVCGISETDASLLDEATLRQQIAGFSSVPIALALSANVRHATNLLAVVSVLPLTDRVAVATSDGQFAGRSGPESLFRKGDVLVRKGSSSERWNQDDADWIVERAVKSRKDQWLLDFSSDFKKLQEAAGQAEPAAIDESAFTKSFEGFQALLRHLLRGSGG